MEWIIPKTDWMIREQHGEYLGDYFNAEDYNRIKNNLICLYEMAMDMYEDFLLVPMSQDKTVYDLLYADEMNAISRNLEIINENTVKLDLPELVKFYDEGKIFDYEYLNIIEGYTLEIYQKIENQYSGRRTLKFNFGKREDI